MEINVTRTNFEKEVMQSEQPVLIDFWASWCGPCRMLSPVIAKIAAEKKGSVKVCKVNVDEEPELARAFSVMSIPAVFVVKNGKVTAQSVGFRPQADIEKLLEQ